MINERVTQFLLISLKNKHTYRRCTKLKLPKVEYPFGIGKCERVRYSSPFPREHVSICQGNCSFSTK